MNQSERPGGDRSAQDSEPSNYSEKANNPGRQRVTVLAADVYFVGSLLWGARTEVLALVADDDIDSPALADLLCAIRRRGKVISTPALALDEWQKAGVLSQLQWNALINATTSGAEPFAVHEYAAAVVAGSLRRRVKSAGHQGHQLLAAADDCPETDLVRVTQAAVNPIIDCADRLASIRGEPL